MSTVQEMVAEFHRVFDPASVAGEPGWPTIEQAQMRMRLMVEELDELGAEFHKVYEGRDNPTDGLVAAAKELADLAYVVYGTAVTLGLDLDAIVERVHASNMTKRWAEDELEAVPIGGTAAFTMTEEGPTIVVYREDGKVLKPPGYEPPDLVTAIWPVDFDKTGLADDGD